MVPRLGNRAEFLEIHAGREGLAIACEDRWRPISRIAVLARLMVSTRFRGTIQELSALCFSRPVEGDAQYALHCCGDFENFAH